MSTKNFRAGVFGAIQTWSAANYPAIPVVYENGPVPDEDKIGPIFLDVEIRWYGAQQLSLSDVTTGRHSGAIRVNVFYREASGTGLSDDVVDSISLALRTRRIGGGLVRFPQRTEPTPQLGWYKTGLLFPFTLDV